MAKVAVCISYRSYPWGGGEEDLYDKCKLMMEYGLDVAWISFVDGVAELKPWNCTIKDGIRHVNVGKPMSKSVIYNILNQMELQPMYTYKKC